MITVTLEAITSGVAGQTLEELMSQAACTCYEGSKPKRGKKIDLKKRIVETGHHTVLQHISANFHIEGISVGDITLGLHLANVFYNSSQRSGRFCANMFSEVDTELLMDYLEEYSDHDGVFSSIKKEVREYIDFSLNIYRENLPAAIKLVEERIKIERPGSIKKESYIEQNAPKIAQEQMRVFVPILFPTADFFTVNLSALSALCQTSHRHPAVDYVASRMAEEISAKHPEISHLFNTSPIRKVSDYIHFNPGMIVKKRPKLELRSMADLRKAVMPTPSEIHPSDLLPFERHLMDNNTISIDTTIEVSLATMGQDQRHRTVRRGRPVFTGNFYLPPIPAIMKLRKEASRVLVLWAGLPSWIRESLAPYGAMVRYDKSASLNAFFHEGSKRLCWCAQEEIYEVSRQLAVALSKQPNQKGKIKEILKVISPPCIKPNGHCGEGDRQCLRNINEARENPFPERTV